MNAPDVSAIIIFSVLFFVIGVTFGALTLYLIMKTRQQKAHQELKIQIKTLEIDNKSLQEKLIWIQKSDQQMKDTFASIASSVLKVNSDELVKRSKEQVEKILGEARGDWKTQKTEIQGMVNPLSDNLKKLDSVVRELEQKREGAYKSLEEQLRTLSKSQTELQNTTITLTQALKSSSTRGRWGELQLRRVVEMAGMVEHVSFDEQVSVDGGRPDMIINLPNGGILPIDAKVPLNAYLASFEATNDSERQSKLKQHAQAMRDRVIELSKKEYWNRFDNAPDYVIMFVPNEACLNAAFETMPELFDYAIENNVLITTPVTLLALLRAAAYGWQQTLIAENAKEIANQGKELYQRLATFTNHLADLRNNLNKTVEAFNAVIGSLEHRVMPSARKLKELGSFQNEIEPPEPIETQGRLPNNIP